MMDLTNVKEGTVISTAEMRERTVKAVTGKYVLFTDGSQYGLRHPDLMEIVPAKEAEDEPKEEKKPAKKAKKKAE